MNRKKLNGENDREKKHPVIMITSCWEDNDQLHQATNSCGHITNNYVLNAVAERDITNCRKACSVPADNGNTIEVGVE